MQLHALEIERAGTAYCGVDEAGRGPLAGPVVAAAVIPPEGFAPDGLNDSKQLTERARERLYDEILASCAVGVGFADEREIDAVNILQATFLSMRRAVDALPTAPDSALVDGNRDPKLPCPALTVVHGDALCVCIAAASVVAKVTRDRYMTALDRQYPQYGFAVHKGYPTKAHYAAVEQYGVSPVHRRSFFVKRPWLLDLPYREETPHV